jgi:hypothetical protein
MLQKSSLLCKRKCCREQEHKKGIEQESWTVSSEQPIVPANEFDIIADILNNLMMAGPPIFATSPGRDSAGF